MVAFELEVPTAFNDADAATGPPHVEHSLHLHRLQSVGLQNGMHCSFVESPGILLLHGLPDCEPLVEVADVKVNAVSARAHKSREHMAPVLSLDVHRRERVSAGASCTDTFYKYCTVSTDLYYYLQVHNVSVCAVRASLGLCVPASPSRHTTTVPYSTVHNLYLIVSVHARIRMSLYAYTNGTSPPTFQTLTISSSSPKRENTTLS